MLLSSRQRQLLGMGSRVQVKGLREDSALFSKSASSTVQDIMWLLGEQLVWLCHDECCVLLVLWHFSCRIREMSLYLGEFRSTKPCGCASYYQSVTYAGCHWFLTSGEGWMNCCKFDLCPTVSALPLSSVDSRTWCPLVRPTVDWWLTAWHWFQFFLVDM